ncbi:uncharacterized protein plecb [Danio aesculapii]|uniref:uncharacterized protein plecb n=1 Tax=Danio aesculapii TaxID=1142201 RepID=UPI0024BFA287|nr:uncharacterized protein plecb [Danio aesculapii]
MVAGMVMPLDNLKAIYEHLFRDGVMVAKKDKRPQTKHPEIAGVQNLQVIRAMGSLKSRGYVTETFAWRHFYWYLTNEGIVYLRDYLHLPAEIVPTPLQRVRRPVATLAVTRRAERVQTIEGPTSYVPKPGKMASEKQDRQGYRRKTASTDEAEEIESNERTPQFRGRPMASAQINSKRSWESKELPIHSDTRDYTKDMAPSARRKVAMHSFSQETHHAKPVEREKMVECTKTAFIQEMPKVSPGVLTISSTAVESPLVSVYGEAVKEKPKEDVSVKVSRQSASITTAKDAHHPTPSKLKVEKTQKGSVSRKMDHVPNVASAEGTIALDSSVHAQVIKEKPKEEEFTKVTQQSTSTVTGALSATPSKPKLEKTQKTFVSKNELDVSNESSKPSVSIDAAKGKPKEDVFIKVSEKTTVVDASKMYQLHLAPSGPKVDKSKSVPAVSSSLEISASKSSESSVSTEAIKDINEELCVSVSKEITSKGDNNAASLPTLSKPKGEKRQKATKTKSVQDITCVPPAEEMSVVKSSASEAVKEKPEEEVCVELSQQTALKNEGRIDKDAPHPTVLSPQVEKTQKTRKNKKMQDLSTFSFTVESSEKAEKPKDDEYIKVTKEITLPATDESKMVIDAPHPTHVEKTVKTLVTKNVQDGITVKSSVSTVPTEAAKEKSNKEVCVIVPQESTSKTDNKTDKDSSFSAPSKSKVGKTAKTTKISNVQDKSAISSTVEATVVTSSMVSVSTDTVKEKEKEEVCVIVSQESTFKGDSRNDAPHPATSTQKVEKMQTTKNVQNKPAVSSAGEMTEVKSSASTEAVKEKSKEQVCGVVSQETTSRGDPAVSKSEVKRLETKNVQDSTTVSSKMETYEVKSSVSLVSTEAVKVKPKEDVCVTVSQETTFTGSSKEDAPSKLKVEKTKKTKKAKTAQDVPIISLTGCATAVESSVVSIPAEKTKEGALIKVSQEATFIATDESKLQKDAPNSTPSKPGGSKGTKRTKHVQEPTVKLEKEQVPAVQAEEVKSNISVTPQMPSEMPKKEENVAGQTAEKKAELNLKKSVAVTSVQAPTNSTVQVADKQQRALDSRTTQGVIEDDSTSYLKVHKEVAIPCAISISEVEAEVKGHKPDPSPKSQPTVAEVKMTSTDSSNASEISTNVESKVDTQKSDQEKTSMLIEEPTTPRDKDAEETSKPSKGKKKKKASKTSAVKEIPSLAETEVGTPSQVDLSKAEDHRQVATSNNSAKTSPEGMHAPENRQPTAVQSEAPAHKGEVEPAQPLAEKREVQKGKTSSSRRQREAPTASASAAAGLAAQHTPLPAQGDPPSVAQHTDTQRSAHKHYRLSNSKAPAGPVTAGPVDEKTCDGQAQTTDDAMRKKIVVVEEVIEVQQVVSPVAGQPTTAPEVSGDDLDYDVLEELAIERGILEGEETFWDHSLQEPEEKTFPNFVEDERDRVQKKTFTKWVNKHLIKTQRHVNDLYEDLRDGHNLISLLEVLSGETLPRERGRMRFHKLQNVQIALDFLRHRQVKLVNIRNDDIADGNPKLTLGLIWTIILHFQISDIQVNGQSDDMSAKEKLLFWSQRMVDGYHGIRCDNFTTSWRDGKLFNAIIHKHEPRFIDMPKVYRQTNMENLEQAFTVAEKELGVTRLLDPEDVDVPHPDEKSIITYVSSLYDAMPRVPDVQDGVKTNELELRWQEYYQLVTVLLQWIRHHVLIFEERRFPSSYEEVEILWRQFLKFKETELPPKESDKGRSKHLFQSFESAVQAGQIKVPPGYHPIDVEKEWGRLHVAILERERLLRIEFERLERLQQIVSKVQMESGVCEEQLNQTESLLQTDIRLLNAGKPAQHTMEVERDLDKADGMIRLLFNDVQMLKDGRHIQAEQMYRRVYRLHERLVNLRSDYNLRLKSSATTATHTTVTSISQKSVQRVRPELDEVTLRYAQDLLAWVEENQRRIDTAEWGIDLPSVESQLGSHRGLHQTIEDFRAKIERARADENQLSPASKGTYREYLGKLDLQYTKLLTTSKSRLRNLDQLYNFVNAATKELMWLNDKEEEEVNYDWSERNANMGAKKDNYSGLMRELELREKKVNDIQATGDRLIKDGHPGKKTVEAFTAALQTQWSWILQLCCCIETHLKENTAYFQFFADVKEADERLKKMQETMKKKYMCDRSTTATRLEDLLQDAVEEREQVNEFKNDIASLNKRAKSVIQLKPRDPTCPFRGKLPIQAVCDFKQMELTMHKGDECALINNSQPSRWKVLNRSGDEAVVPSICFLVPPVNKEAVESVSGLEAGHQQTVILWQKLHADLRALLSWQYLMKDIQLIRSWNITMFKTMKPDEYRLILRNLQLHYQDFLKDRQESKLFDSSDSMQIERDYKETTQHFDNLLRTMEKGAAVRAQGSSCTERKATWHVFRAVESVADGVQRADQSSQTLAEDHGEQTARSGACMSLQDSFADFPVCPSSPESLAVIVAGPHPLLPANGWRWSGVKGYSTAGSPFSIQSFLTAGNQDALHRHTLFYGAR